MTTNKTESTTAKLIDRANDVGDFASTDPTRYPIAGIHVTSTGTEATDGAIAIRVPFPGIDPAEFPPTNTPNELPKPVIVPVKALREALKNVPKRTTLPVLSTVKVSSKGDCVVHFATTDLETERSFAVKPVEAQYPSFEADWPKPEACKLRVAVSAENLAKIADYALKHGNTITENERDTTTIILEFSDERSVVGFSFQLADKERRATGCFMPVRME